MKRIIYVLRWMRHQTTDPLMKAKSFSTSSDKLSMGTITTSTVLSTSIANDVAHLHGTKCISKESKRWERRKKTCQKLNQSTRKTIESLSPHVPTDKCQMVNYVSLQLPLKFTPITMKFGKLRFTVERRANKILIISTFRLSNDSFIWYNDVPCCRVVVSSQSFLRRQQMFRFLSALILTVRIWNVNVDFVFDQQ